MSVSGLIAHLLEDRQEVRQPQGYPPGLTARPVSHAGHRMRWRLRLGLPRPLRQSQPLLPLRLDVQPVAVAADDELVTRRLEVPHLEPGGAEGGGDFPLAADSFAAFGFAHVSALRRFVRRASTTKYANGSVIPISTPVRAAQATVMTSPQTGRSDARGTPCGPQKPSERPPGHTSALWRSCATHGPPSPRCRGSGARPRAADPSAGLR